MIILIRGLPAKSENPVFIPTHAPKTVGTMEAYNNMYVFLRTLFLTATD
jgi:hypothetical protein